MLRLGVIGYGYWGPNVVRNFASHSDCRVVAVCDSNPKALARLRGHYPAIRGCSDEGEILTSPEIDAVAIVTPVSTHYGLARKAIEQGKHVFVEKPFTSRSAEAEKLIVDGFFDEVIERVPVESVQKTVRAAIDRKIGYTV